MFRKWISSHDLSHDRIEHQNTKANKIYFISLFVIISGCSNAEDKAKDNQTSIAVLESKIRKLQDDVDDLNASMTEESDRTKNAENTLSTSLTTLSNKITSTEGDLISLNDDFYSLAQWLDKRHEERIYVWDNNDSYLGKLFEITMFTTLWFDNINYILVEAYWTTESDGIYNPYLYYLTDNCSGSPYMVTDAFRGVINVLDQNDGSLYGPAAGAQWLDVTLRARKGLFPSSVCEPFNPTEYKAVEFEQYFQYENFSAPISIAGSIWDPPTERRQEISHFKKSSYMSPSFFLPSKNSYSP